MLQPREYFQPWGYGGDAVFMIMRFSLHLRPFRERCPESLPYLRRTCPQYSYLLALGSIQSSGLPLQKACDGAKLRFTEQSARDSFRHLNIPQ